MNIVIVTVAVREIQGEVFSRREVVWSESSAVFETKSRFDEEDTALLMSEAKRAIIRIDAIERKD